MSYLPTLHNLNGVLILIIGGGRIALAKLETLVNYTSQITIIAEEFDLGLEELAKQHNLLLIKASYSKEQLEGKNLIIAATDEKEVNRQIADDARAKGILVNAVDDAKYSDFIFPAIVQRGGISVGIASGGTSPVLSRLLKQSIEKALPHNLESLDKFTRENRDVVKAKFSDIQARRLFWQDVIEGEIAENVLNGNDKKAQELFDNKLSGSINKKSAAVYFIGAGPGNPDLITLRAIKLLSRADIVLYDRLVAKEILNYARKDALKINVGKTRDCHKYNQGEINELIKKYASEGNIVARLKGGDPAIFAHLYEEIDAIKDLKVPYEVVPGITAVSGASAFSAIALTGRNIAKALRILTLYKDDILNDEYWAELAKTDDTLAFYMSAVNATLICDNLLKHGKNLDVGIAVIEQATTVYQKTYFSTIGQFTQEFAEKKFVSPSLIIIGEVVNKAKGHQWLEEFGGGEFFENFDKFREEQNVK